MGLAKKTSRARAAADVGERVSHDLHGRTPPPAVAGRIDRALPDDQRVDPASEQGQGGRQDEQGDDAGQGGDSDAGQGDGAEEIDGEDEKHSQRGDDREGAAEDGAARPG